MTTEDADNIVYQLKITLNDVEPPVWRRIQVPADTNLYRLHLILQDVMGWENYHLFQFTIGGQFYGDPDVDDGPEVKHSRTQKLRRFGFQQGDRFLYEYDFGDGWEHLILVEKALPADPDVQYPICLEGQRACPPEDCGGPWGYAELLRILQDPEDPAYEQMRSWAPQDFDPEHFNLKHVNTLMKSHRPRRRRGNVR